MNRVILIGNVGANLELKVVGGQPKTEIRLATSEPAGNGTVRTEWHRVVVWGNQAENCAKYLSKGRQICVEGRLQSRSWDGNDGQKHYVTEIIASNVHFLAGGKKNEELVEEGPSI